MSRMSTDRVRDRRRRPGRRQGRRDAARRGLRRPRRARRRRARSCPTSGRRCPRSTCSAGPTGRRPTCTPPDWYAEHDVDLRTGVRAVAPDPAAHRLALDAGDGCATTSCCSPPVRRPGGSTSRAPTSTASATCARSPTADRLLADFTGAAGGWSSSAPAGSAWRSPRPPARTASRSRSSSRSPRRCTRVLGPEHGPGRSPSCTATTASTCAPAPASREFRGAGGRVRAVGHRRAREIPADLVVVGVGVAPNVELADGGRAGGRQRRSSPTPPCGPRRPTCSPPATSPTPFHPLLRPARPGRALGQRAERRPGRGRGRCSARTSATTGCPTSSPTSTTSGMEYSGSVAPGDTRGRPAATRTTASSSPSGSTDGRVTAGHERQRLGRHRPDPGADPRRRPVAVGARRPRRPAGAASPADPGGSAATRPGTGGGRVRVPRTRQVRDSERVTPPKRGTRSWRAWTGSRSSSCAPSRSATSASCGCGSPTSRATSSRSRSRRPRSRPRSPRASASTARRSRASPGSTSPTCSPSPTRPRSR